MFRNRIPLFLAHLCMSTPLVLAAPPEPTRVLPLPMSIAGSDGAQEADPGKTSACGERLTGVAQAEPAILQSEYAKWRASLPDDYPQLADYRRMLLFWVVGAEQYWLKDPAHPKLGKCRFTTKHVHVRTARVLPAYAALAADPDCRHPVWTRQKLIERINSAIGFLCATYSFGKPAEDFWSKRPGRNSLRYETWVIGNMVDALQIVPEAITPEHKKCIRDILIDVIEDERTSGRAHSLADYRHEGITWTMNLLARAAVLYADDPRADEWLDLAKYGYASSLSVEADSQDETVVDGKPIKEWVSRRQGVFYPDFTLSHHGLGIHPGYMAISGHRMVSLYDLVKRRNKHVSPIWHRHFADMTGVLKDLTLWDGRIAFPNGKDWADYVYGVSAARFDMVGLQMMFGDGEARLIEQGLFRHIDWLQRTRGRGDLSPGDAEYIFSLNDMKNIAYAYWLHQAHGFARPVTQEAFDRAHAKVLHSPLAKFVCVRGPSRFASWGWGAGKRRTTGAILPRGHDLGDHLAQWDSNLRPDYWTVDKDGKWNYLHSPSATRQVETFQGGFAVSERSEFVRKGSEAGEPVLLDHRVMVAIPDGRTVLFVVSGRATKAVQKLSTTDINWRFVRSIFSGMQRTIYYEGGRQECRHVHNVPTPWLNVDGILGVVSIGQPMRVSCKLLDKVDGKGSPVAERSSYGVHSGQTVRLSVRSLVPGDFERGQNILTAGVAFVTDVDGEETKRLATAFREEKPANTVRVYHVRGQDGKEYVVAVNFADSEETVDIADPPTVRLLTPKASSTSTKTDRNLQLRLVPRGCAVLACPS